MDAEHPGVMNIPIIVARVAEIRITGNRATRAFVIRREMKTREGAYYNRKELSEDVQRLGRLGLFSDAEPHLDVVAADKVSIQMKLTENKLRTYNFGSSYGGGVLAGFVEVKDNNFRGQDEQLGLHVENGITSNRHAYQISFSEPYVDRRGTRLQLSAYDTTNSVFANSVANLGSVGSGGALVQEKAGGTLQLERFIGAGYSVSAGLRAESIHTDPLSLGGSSAALLQDGPLSVVSGTVTHSSLDQRAEPHRGALQALTLQVGHTHLTTATLSPDPIAAEAAGDHSYVRGGVDLQRFISLQKPPKDPQEKDNRTTIAMRFQASSTSGTTPFTEQLFLGGATGLRGYRDGRFWGQNLTSGTLELRQPLGNGIKGVLFTEAGDAWGGIYQGVSLQGLPQTAFKLHGSAGLGLRVGTPIGLVRLDYGYGDEGGRVHFGIGYSF
jgi:outer membrane protein insertion porin family